jgi:transposase InsO family protein
MCRVLHVSASGYYHWLGRPVSVRGLRHDLILVEIKNIHQGVRRSYGYPRVYEELLSGGIDCSESTVCYLMRKNGIKAKRKRKFVTTTDSNHDLPVKPNLLGR